MKLVGGLIGGIIGGLVGAAIWAGISYGLNYEIGWIAVGVGFLSGLGVFVGTSGQGGLPGGAMAAVIAIIAIALGKFFAIAFAISSVAIDDEYTISTIADVVIEERIESGRPTREPDFEGVDHDSLEDYYAADIWREAVARWEGLTDSERDRWRDIPGLANPDFYLSDLADDIVIEKESAGEMIDWPAGKDFDSAWREAHYPPSIWAEAEARVAAMSPDERSSWEQGVRDLHREWNEMAEGMMQREAFSRSFGFFDLLWGVLAVGAAFGMGARGMEGD